MSTIKVSEKVNHNRRRFLRNAAMTLAATELAAIGSAKARPIHDLTSKQIDDALFG